MNLWRLVIREVRHRKVNFALSVLCVLNAAGVLVAAVKILESHDLRTQQILARKEADLRTRLGELDRDVRRAMSALGFNVVILPAEQDLADWHANDYAAKTMPEAYVSRLRQAGVVTVEHLVPRLRAKTKWPEANWTVILVGTGETSLPAAEEATGWQAPRPPRGKLALGHEIHQGLGLETGRTVRLLGREFVVHRRLPERGTADDVTVWMRLDEAQELLGKQGLINEILALECRCAWADLPQVRAEIARILPDTRVIEKASQALAKAEARQGVAEKGEAMVAAEREGLARMRESIGRALWLLVPFLAALYALFLGLLTSGNVWARRAEIGLLMALGFRSRQVLVLLLWRAAATALVGGGLGFVAGQFAGLLMSTAAADGAAAAAVTADWKLLGAALVAAFLVSAVASLGPSLRAARSDPAEALGGR